MTCIYTLCCFLTFSFYTFGEEKKLLKFTVCSLCICTCTHMRVSERVCVNEWMTEIEIILLGSSGGVVSSPDFCPASLKSLGCFYFQCVLSSQWKAVSVNL